MLKKLTLKELKERYKESEKKEKEYLFKIRKFKKLINEESILRINILQEIDKIENKKFSCPQCGLENEKQHCPQCNRIDI